MDLLLSVTLQKGFMVWKMVSELLAKMIVRFKFSL